MPVRTKERAEGWISKIKGITLTMGQNDCWKKGRNSVRASWKPEEGASPYHQGNVEVYPEAKLV